MALDPEYRPDSLDQISADVRAIGMIYSFYGRLSVSNNNVDELRAGNIPPTFYTYGTEDPFYRQFNQNVEAVRQTGVLVESHVLEGWPHVQPERGGRPSDRSAGGVARAGRLAARLRCAGRMDHVVRQFPHRHHDKRRIRRHKL